MVRRIFKLFFGAVFLLGEFFCLSAQETAVSSLFHYTLENGLELFVMENDSAPLAYIEIAVKAGAVTQTPENAGLFHLYEHMMFKGNEKYPNQKEAYSALNKMGVSDWNGTTSIDRVNYFFTVPAALLKDGLEYWSYAVRTPLLDKQELENEKAVVLSEIEGGLSEPGRVFGAGVFKEMFPSCPWKTDTSGSPQIIKNAAAEDLKKIQEEYYVPANTALFVGGAVEHNEVYSLVNEIYGSWQNGKNAIIREKIETSPKNLFKTTKKLVFPDPRSSKNIGRLVFYLRGPDAQTEPEDTYAADVWSYLLANPAGSFVSEAVGNGDFNIPDADYIGGGYSTMRATGLISFSAAFMNDEKLSVTERAELILDYWKNQAVKDAFKNGTGYDESDIAKVKDRLEDSRIYSMETASGFLKGLSAEWASAGTDYALSYDANIVKVTRKDVTNFVEKYIKDKNGLAVLFVNPGYYEEHKKEFEKSGWQELNSENARWWKESK